MAPITVRFNGPLAVEERIETPDSEDSVRDYLEAFAEAHIPDDGRGFVATVDGEPVDLDGAVEDLAGCVVFLNVMQPDAGTDLDPADSDDGALPNSIDDRLAYIDAAEADEDKLARARRVYDDEIEGKARKTLVEQLIGMLAGTEFDPAGGAQ